MDMGTKILSRDRIARRSLNKEADSTLFAKYQHIIY